MRLFREERIADEDKSSDAAQPRGHQLDGGEQFADQEDQAQHQHKREHPHFGVIVQPRHIPAIHCLQDRSEQSGRSKSEERELKDAPHFLTVQQTIRTKWLSPFDRSSGRRGSLQPMLAQGLAI